LIDAGDTEAAISVALEVATFDHERGLSIEDSPGVDILVQLPREKVVPVIARLASIVVDDDSRMLARDIFMYAAAHDSIESASMHKNGS